MKLWDVIIVGSGPSGSALAITLAKQGREVLLIEEHKTTPSFKLGESIAPSAITMVQTFLGKDIESKEPDIFRKSTGNIAAWMDSKEDLTDFFFTLSGYGLCIDRVKFDEALRLKAVEEGASLIRGYSFRECKRVFNEDHNWVVKIVSDSEETICHGRYLVDCTGRRASVAKSLDAELMLDSDKEMFAYATWYLSNENDNDTYTRIEAVPDGWWYSNRLPFADNEKSKRLVIFFTDRDLPITKQILAEDGFNQTLQEDSELISSLIRDKKYYISERIKGAPANSQRISTFTGDCWMAVGDSAQAYDALSSQGIDKALKTASHAGYMIHYALEDHDDENIALKKEDNRFIQQYEDEQQRLWLEYLKHKNYYYDMQGRWNDRTFWSRRKQ